MNPTPPSSRFRWLSLRRIVTSNHFIPEVDGFRFVAIFMVVFAHIYVQCGPVPDSGVIGHALRRAFFDGGHGVYLFFTISGFILALPFARHHLQSGKTVKLKSYFRRRITRLEPPYVLALLLRVPALVVVRHTALSTLLVPLLASIFYVHNLVYAHASTINPPAWSLEVEIQFYILAPVLTALFLIRTKGLRRAVLAALILISALLANHYLTMDTRAGLSLLHYLHYFLAGFLLCDLYLCGDRFSMPPWLWDVSGIAVMSWILFSAASWYQVALPFAAVVLYMAGFYGYLVRRFFSFTPVSVIGGMCYSIYLTHSTVLAAFTGLARHIERSPLPVILQLGLLFGSCAAAVIAVGMIYFVMIERPCMDPEWPHKLMVRLRGR